MYMSGGLGPVTVEVKFNGESYLAEVTPTINGKPVALRPEMHQAETFQHIYTSQLQAMLSKPELAAAYKPGFGFLTEATLNGFIFEKGSIVHAAGKTETLWKGFVDSLHAPEPILTAAPKSTAATTPSELGPGLQASFRNISAYMNLPSSEKKKIHKSTLFKVLKHLQQLPSAPFTDLERQYLKHFISMHKIGKKETKRLIGLLHQNLLDPKNADEKLNDEEKRAFYAEWREIRQSAFSVPNPVVQGSRDD